VAENLGEVLGGDRIATSAYALRLRAPTAASYDDEAGGGDANANATEAATPATLLCQTRLRGEDAEALRRRIDEGYRAHMLLDNLPVRLLQP
jgi:hypothetical protein